MHDFTDRIILVTGGSRGIGRAIAQAFAARGAQVAVNFRSNEKAARQTLDSLAGDGHCLVQADVGTAEGAVQVVERAVAGPSGLDTVVNRVRNFPPVQLSM